MKAREIKEFGKWVIDRGTVIMFGEMDDFYEKYIERRNEEMKGLLELLRKDQSVGALKDETFGDYQRFLRGNSFWRLQEKEFRNGQYSGVSSLYTSCSLRLNREFRKLHDEICYLLNQ